MHPQEFSAADSLHSRAVDGQWGVVNGVPPPEVQHNFLCLPHIEGQIVSATPFSQLCHFLSVVRSIVVADETYHCCVISEFDDVVGAELGRIQLKSRIQLQMELLWPSRFSSFMSCCGIIVLNAELKSMNSILT